MPSLNRIFLIKLHTFVACMLFPVILMFLISGALYTLGVHGTVKKQRFELVLPEGFKPSLAATQSLALKQLRAREIDIPNKKPWFKDDKKGMRMFWGGANISALLKIAKDKKTATLNITKPSWYQRFVRLHKAKGASWFKIYAVAMASGLIILLCSGFIMAWQIPKFRKLATISSLSGIILFMLLVLIS